MQSPTDNKYIWIVGALIVFLLILAGTSRMNLKAKRGPVSPEIPEKIRAGKYKEPQLEVYISEEEQTRTMAFEEYIKGVVAGEMDPDWEVEALAAQAIIARSFTLQKIKEMGGVPARNADASTNIEEFQAYDAASITERVTQAVDKTRGLAAVHNGEYIRGWFHAFAGPRTALADEGLNFKAGNPPYIKIVKSPGGKVIPPEEDPWEASFSLSEVRNAVCQAAGEDPGEINRFEIAKKGPSGRATRFRANNTFVAAPEFRIALGSTKMRSTLIEDIELTESNLIFKGTGYGHGVGMCQWGARTLAQQGKSAEEIIKYYYRDVDVVKIWD